ncbi:hypothetical protein [Flaviaesturariibacter amylovorans]|uniref:DUF1963 domain-containing protein n=1 Tax=Flaviaesturariibacter amylovorans TaxID=1084520 RepID=A0ABP8HP97_9BACT
MRLCAPLLLCLVGICNSALAQPATGKTYAETKREQDAKKYQSDYIDGTRYNRNSSSRSSSSSGSGDAAQQLADQWRRNSGRRTEAEQRAWEAGATAREEYRKRMEAEERERKLASMKVDPAAAERARQEAARLEAQEAARKPLVEKKVAEYVGLGFHGQEARRFAEAVTNYPDGRNSKYLEADRVAARKAEAARKKYNAVKNTATYEELASLIPAMHAASTTSMQAWQDLARRFPEKKSETERWEFWAMAALFDRHPSEHPDVAGLQQKATGRFFELFAREPAAAIESVGAFTVDYYHPLYMGAIYNKMETEEGRRWAEVLLLGTTNNSPYNRRNEWRKVMFESGWSVDYWKKKTNADWEALADMANLPQIAVFERLAGVPRNRLALGAGQKGLPRTNNQFQDAYGFLWKEIADLAAAGEPSCMNAYGFLLASDGKSSGKERKRGFTYLQQAVDSGVLWAPLNLLFLAEMEKEGAPHPDSAYADVRRRLERASAHYQYLVAAELKARLEDKSIDKKHVYLAKTLALWAADGGHTAGQALNLRPDWVDLAMTPGIVEEKDWGRKYEGLVVPGQRTLFTSWPAAVTALPNFKSLTYEYLDSKTDISFPHKEAFVVYPRTLQIGARWGDLQLPDPKVGAYTFKMNFSMVQNPSPDGFFGLSWHGPTNDVPIVFFMINPARREYYFGAGGNGRLYEPYHKPKQYMGNGYSTAINPVNSVFYSSNEIGFERNGNQVKLLINGTVVEVIDISKYAPVFEKMSHVGYGYKEGKFGAWIRDFFVSVKE